MKRQLVKLVVFLLLLGGGAIVNVAVAWGCSWWGIPHYAAVGPMNTKAFWNHAKTGPKLAKSELPVVVSDGFGFVERWAIAENIGGTEHLNLEQLCDLLHANFKPDTDNILEAAMNSTDQQGAKYISLRTDAGWPLQALRGWGPASQNTYQEGMRHQIQWMPDGKALVVLRQVQGVRSGTLVRLLPLRPPRAQLSS